VVRSIQRSTVLAKAGSGSSPTRSKRLWNCLRSKDAVTTGPATAAPGTRCSDEPVDCLLTAPPERVQSAVDDEAAGTPRVGRITAHPGDVVAVQAHLVGEPFAVEPPALCTCGVVQHAPCQRELGRLHRDRQLQMVARHGFVERDVLGGATVPLPP
jgi:hypothetical protein